MEFFLKPFSLLRVLKKELKDNLINCYVTLKVYDITGRVVSTLFNNEGLNAGTFKYTFDGSSMASGVYFYRIETKTIDSTIEKMVIIR